MSNTQLNQEWRIYDIEAVSQIESQPLLAIIEPKYWFEWKSILYTYIEFPRFDSLFKDTPFSHIDQGPVIMDMSGSAELTKLCIEMMEKIPCGCLLAYQKTVDWDALLKTLRAGLVVLNEHTQIILRYFEPRTLLPLMAVMSDEERGLFFPQITNIYWFTQQKRNKSELSQSGRNKPASKKQWLNAPIPAIQNAQTRDKAYQWTITKSHTQMMQSTLEQWQGAK